MIKEFEERLAELERERTALLAKLREARIRNRGANRPALDFDGRSYPETAAERVKLFRKLFVARSDVYPRRWENAQSGRSGYSPVCEPVYENGSRLKPTEIFRRYGASKFGTLGEREVEAHLRGEVVVGTYAIRPDDSCIFLAADFDGEGWKADARAYREECDRVGTDALVEISRSGNGAHVWVLFSEPVPAYLARRMGSFLLSRAASRHPRLRLDTYDRFFPNQDTLPRGGFGNLIALPLQKERRALGFTEFVDEEFVLKPDPWRVLAAVRRLTRGELDEINAEANPGISVDRDEAWEAEHAVLQEACVDPLDLPKLDDRKGLLTENLVVPTDGLPPTVVARLRMLATFPNPVFWDKQRQRFPTFNIPRYIFSGEVHDDRVVLPRGLIDDVVELFAGCGARFEAEDRRLKPRGIRVRFRGELSTRQKAAVATLRQHEHGVLVAPPGAGKTVMACSPRGRCSERDSICRCWIRSS